MKKYIIVFLSLFLSAASFAQKISVEGAYALFLERYNDRCDPFGYEEGVKLTHGIVVNGLCEIETSSKISVVHGLGAGLSLGGGGKLYETFLDIYAPLYVKYKFAEIGDSFTVKPFVMAGAMASVNIFEKYKWHTNKENYRRFDIKPSLYCGVDMKNLIRVRLCYSLGLLNRYSDDVYRHNKDVLSLGVSYLF